MPDGEGKTYSQALHAQLAWTLEMPGEGVGRGPPCAVSLPTALSNPNQLKSVLRRAISAVCLQKKSVTLLPSNTSTSQNKPRLPGAFFGQADLSPHSLGV